MSKQHIDDLIPNRISLDGCDSSFSTCYVEVAMGEPNVVDHTQTLCLMAMQLYNTRHLAKSHKMENPAIASALPHARTPTLKKYPRQAK